jgi:uncharacterized protein involved in response to NO
VVPTAPIETEASFATKPPGSVWRAEPFRLFFPLGVVLSWIGVGHWLLYATGVTRTYSCMGHGLVQMQSFAMAFAVGFLLTALPRRTRAAAPSGFEMALLALALVVTATSAIAESWVASEVAYGSVFAILLQFALRRFRRGGRRPPAAFVLIPLAFLQGLAGAVAIAVSTFPSAPPWTEGLGRLLVEQGVFLCLVIGVGSLFLPLVAGAPPPPDLDSSPREKAKALAYFAAGAAIVASLFAETAGFACSAPLARAAVVALGLGLGGGAWRRPGKPGLHRRLIWLSAWLVPAGVAASGIWPDYRVPALHVLFIGGFGLLMFSVATHVSLGHLGLERLALGRPPAVALFGVLFLLAMAARVAADFAESYFGHLAWAAGLWIAASMVWLLFLGPKLLRIGPGAV